MQAKINAACNAALTGGNTFTTPVVVFPAGSYYYGTPLVDACPRTDGPAPLTLRGEGRNATEFVPNFNGPAIMVVPPHYISSLNRGVITGASLAAGSGVSLYHNATNEWFSLDITAAMGAQYINGKSTLDARAFIKPTALGTNMVIFGSFGSRDYAICKSASGLVCDGAYLAWKGSDDRLHCQITTNNNGPTEYTAVSAGAMTAAVHEAECGYDGIHLGAALDGAWGTLRSATGTILQRADEVTVVGAGFSNWPHLGIANIFQGYIDSVELGGKQGGSVYHAIGANYRADTAKFSDTNNYFLFNFEKVVYMPGTTQPVMFGADHVYNDHIFGDSTNAWAPIHAQNIGCCGNHYFLSDFSIQSGTIGIDAEEAEITVSHVYLSTSYMGVHTGPAATYGTVIDDVRAIMASTSIGMLVLEGGINTVHKVYTTCGAGCDYVRGALEYDGFLNPQSNTLFGLDVVNYGYHIVADFDTENGGRFSALRFQSDPAEGYGQFNVDGGFIAGSNASPIRLVPGGDRAMQVVMHAPRFATNGATSIFDVSSVSANFETVPIFVDGATALPAGVSWLSDPTHWQIDVRGVTNMAPSHGFNLRYSAAEIHLPTCNANNDGDRRCVKDATACTSGTAYRMGGGSTLCEVWCNGRSSAWTESGSGC